MVMKVLGSNAKKCICPKLIHVIIFRKIHEKHVWEINMNNNQLPLLAASYVEYSVACVVLVVEQEIRAAILPGSR